MNISEAIIQFRSAADEKGNGAGSTEKAVDDHRLFELMADAWRVLQGHGSKGDEAFRSLVEDDSRHVRLWAASQLLGLGDETILPIIESEASKGDFTAFLAEMTLAEWKKGRLGPPFGDS